MSCSTAIPYVENNPNMIYLGGTILNEFASIYYNDKNDSFEMMFQIYTYSSVNNIYHP